MGNPGNRFTTINPSVRTHASIRATRVQNDAIRPTHRITDCGLGSSFLVTFFRRTDSVVNLPLFDATVAVGVSRQTKDDDAQLSLEVLSCDLRSTMAKTVFFFWKSLPNNSRSLLNRS